MSELRAGRPAGDRKGRFGGSGASSTRGRTDLRRLAHLGRLAGGIAHDFNNLLTALEGHLDMAEAGPSPRERSQSFASARRCAGRAARLSRRLMELSRGERFDPHPLPAADVVRGALPLLQSLLGPRIELTVRLDPEAHAVLVDVGLIERALMNLVPNARDAMPGGGRLSVAVDNHEVGPEYLVDHPWARAGSYARIEVRDSGAGIPYEDQARIFDAHFTTKPGGGGLGLSVVYSIVKQHRGFIHLESEPGAGTSFLVLLPAARRPAAATAAAPAETGDRVPAGEAGAATILFVDDEEMVLELARTKLVGCGYRVLAAGSAGAAEASFERVGGAVDLLVTDLVLPGRGGAELARTLCQRAPGLPVLFTSGYGRDELPSHLAPEPAGELLQKPYTLARLLDRVEKRLAQRSARRSDA